MKNKSILYIVCLLLVASVVSAVDINKSDSFGVGVMDFIASKNFTVTVFTNSTANITTDGIVIEPITVTNHTVNFSITPAVKIFTQEGGGGSLINFSRLTTNNNVFNATTVTAAATNAAFFINNLTGVLFIFNYGASNHPSFTQLNTSSVTDVEYALDATNQRLDINCTGSGNIVLEDMRFLAGGLGYYEAFLSNSRVTRTNSDTFTITSCGDWDFRSTEEGLITGTTSIIVRAIGIIIGLIVIVALGAAMVTGNASIPFLISIIIATVIAIVSIVILNSFIL